MKAIVSVYLSFVVALAVLVGAAGFYAQADRGQYAENDWMAAGGAMQGIGHY